MTSRTIPKIYGYESTAQFWIEILQRLPDKRARSSPAQRMARRLRIHWKSMLVSLAFWVVYGYAYLVMFAK
ncbi:MAG TPA: hypothetical protein VN577_03980 [Terriglobales bacterium]|nr:hypothetical protein [Terriglobales bacterium]